MKSPSFTADDLKAAIDGVVASGREPIGARIDPATGVIEIQFGKSLAERLEAIRFEIEAHRWAHGKQACA